MTTNGGNRIYINLLPKEVIDKRKAEERLAYALLVAVAVGAFLFAVFALNVVRISASERSIKRLEKENANYAVAIDEIRGFQDKQVQVEQREKLIESVSPLTFSWSKFLNDVSLIIPNDVWLTQLNSDNGVISFEGKAFQESTGTTDIGHKLVAKWLVHLGQLDQLTDVWLTTSQKEEKTEGRVTFTTTAKIKQPETKISPPVVPAPPSSGQTGGGSQ